MPETALAMSDEPPTLVNADAALPAAQRRSKRLLARSGANDSDSDETPAAAAPPPEDVADNLMYAKLVVFCMNLAAIALLRWGDPFNEMLFSGAPLTRNDAFSIMLGLVATGILAGIVASTFIDK